MSDDKLEARDLVEVTVAAALVMKSAANLVGCDSRLRARLAFQDLCESVRELALILKKGEANDGQNDA